LGSCIVVSTPERIYRKINWSGMPNAGRQLLPEAGAT